jgi:hypothetical protein
MSGIARHLPVLLWVAGVGQLGLIIASPASFLDSSHPTIPQMFQHRVQVGSHKCRVFLLRGSQECIHGLSEPW